MTILEKEKKEEQAVLSARRSIKEWKTVVPEGKTSDFYRGSVSGGEKSGNENGRAKELKEENTKAIISST